MYHIRFHGRGGQGMKTAANILGSAFFGEGFEVQDAPRYGAERRGAPVFAYVRAARQPINERGVIVHSGLVVVADDTLVASSAAGVMLGVGAHTVLLINSAEPDQTWKERLNFPGIVLTLPLSPELPVPTALPVQGVISAAIAGAAARLTGVIGRQALEAAVRGELGVLPHPLRERNVQCALSAYDAMAGRAGIVAESAEDDAAMSAPDWIDIPRDAVHIAAPDIHATATSEQSPTGAWRTLRPVIDYERCNRCSWICGTLCPDSAIGVDGVRTPHIDYDHCKGCMVCMAVCPAHAVSAVLEREHIVR